MNTYISNQTANPINPNSLKQKEKKRKKRNKCLQRIWRKTVDRGCKSGYIHTLGLEALN